MKRIIKENSVLILCYLGFLLFVFKMLDFTCNWSSLWQVPSYQMNTFKMIIVNLPWLGVSFYHFIMMRTNFENSFTLRLLRLGSVKKVCRVFNVRLLTVAAIAGIMYVVLAELTTMLTQLTWLQFDQGNLVRLLVMVLLIFMIGLSQLVLSTFLDARLGLLIQLCYSVFSLLVGRLLVLNGHTEIWQQIFFWPQWLTVVRLEGLQYSVVQIVVSLGLIILLLEITLYVSIKQKDWLG